MSVSPPLSILNIYDIYADFVPGITLSIYIIIVIAPEWVESFNDGPGVALAGLIALGIVLGQVLQWMGSKLDNCLNEGAEHVFEETLKKLEVEEDGGRDCSNDSESPPDDCSSKYIDHIWCRIYGWLFGFIFYEKELGITPIEEDFRERFKEQFYSTSCFPNKQNVFYLSTGYLINQGVDRTTRFQALHAFFRSMWAASLFAFFLLLIRIIRAQGDLVIFQPNLLLPVLGNLFLIMMFWGRKRKFEKVFVRHLFQDFHQLTSDR